MEAELTRGGLCCLVNTPRAVLCESDWVTRKVNPQCLSTLPSQEVFSTYPAQSGRQSEIKLTSALIPSLAHLQRATVLLPKGTGNWDKCFNPRMEKKSPFLHHVPFEKPHSSEAKFIVSLCDSLLCFFFFLLLLLLKTGYLRAVIEFRF